VASGKAWVVLQHVAHEESGAIGEALVSTGQVVSVVRVDRGDPVPRPGEVADMAGVVVMGGPMGVHDDEAHPWLAHERDLMAAAVAAELPGLGVCLGAQQLAVALGGEVTTGPEPEIGIGEVHLTRQAEDDAVFGPVGSTLPCMHWHRDTFSLPDGSALLARSELCPHQAFRGDLVVSLTGNPNDGSFNGGNGEVVISYADPTATTSATVATTTTTLAHVTASTSSSTAPALAVTGVDVMALLIAGSTLIGVGTLILAGSATSRRKRTRTP
jgi:GMP synthase-like glutamine amidotransferase